MIHGFRADQPFRRADPAFVFRQQVRRLNLVVKFPGLRLGDANPE